MTDKLRGAAQQALDFILANGEHDQLCGVFALDDDGLHMPCTCGLEKTLSALRAALAQQEAQAESQGWRSMDTAPLGVTAFFWIKWSDVPVIGEWDGKSLSANHEHLDVSCGAYCYGGSVCTAGHTEPTLWMPLPPAPDAAPTPPAQRVMLTDEEIDEVWNSIAGHSIYAEYQIEIASAMIEAYERKNGIK